MKIKFCGPILTADYELHLLKIYLQTIQIDDEPSVAVEKPTVLKCFWQPELLQEKSKVKASVGCVAEIGVTVKGKDFYVSSIQSRYLCQRGEIRSIKDYVEQICAKKGE